MGAQLAVRDLSVEYQAPEGGILPALGPVTFDILPGSFICLLGPSGCGKSTLVRVLAGLQSATRGDAYLGSERILKPSRQVGVMFQDANLMPWRTVIENIALPLELSGVEKRERLETARHMLPGLGLGIEFAEAYPGELSGGMAQRVALGRVLIQRPEVLLLDEPFGALDAFTREQISIDLMQMWMTLHQTVVMVTHNIDEAVLLSDRVLVFSQRPGQITADIAVDLPRPRRIEDSYGEMFGRLAGQVRAAVKSA
ncbi:MAG: ATP-binding cassette domain-containing protein [Anaerolineaceae bacterium]|nr:ATP-binding cassette domain-containing protein [Anaerolineaceae bacterium]